MEWDIYNKADERVATWKSQDVRLALIHGQIDPFTIIAPAGNADLKKTVMETDAIFEENISIERTVPPTFDSAPNIQRSGTKEAAGEIDNNPPAQDYGFEPELPGMNTEPASLKEAIAKNFFPEPQKSEEIGSPENTSGENNSGFALANPDILKKLKKTHETPGKHGNFKQLARPAKRSFSARQHTKKSRQRYFLHTGLKKMGPFRAKDLAKSYYKGQLPENAKISILGEKKKIPVDKFIAAFTSGKAGGNAHMANYDSGPAPQSSPLEDPVTMGAIVTIALVSIALLVYYLQSSINPSSSQQRRSNNYYTEPTRSTQPRKVVRKPATAKKQPPPKKIIVRPKPKPKPATPRTTRPTPRRLQPRVVNRPTPRRAPQVTRPARTTGSPTSIASVKANGRGKVVTIGPVRLNQGQISSCTGRCTITLSDGTGSVSAVFFKQAHGAKLSRLNGPVYVRGRLNASGTSLVLQGASTSR